MDKAWNSEKTKMFTVVETQTITREYKLRMGRNIKTLTEAYNSYKNGYWNKDKDGLMKDVMETSTGWVLDSEQSALEPLPSQLHLFSLFIFNGDNHRCALLHETLLPESSSFVPDKETAISITQAFPARLLGNDSSVKDRVWIITLTELNGEETLKNNEVCVTITPEIMHDVITSMISNIFLEIFDVIDSERGCNYSDVFMHRRRLHDAHFSKDNNTISLTNPEVYFVGKGLAPEKAIKEIQMWDDLTDGTTITDVYGVSTNYDTPFRIEENGKMEFIPY